MISRPVDGFDVANHVKFGEGSLAARNYRALLALLVCFGRDCVLISLFILVYLQFQEAWLQIRDLLSSTA